MARWPKDEKSGAGKEKKTQGKRKRRPVDTEADWSAQDAGVLRDIISNVTSDDGAVRFGYSRDGGAYSVGIYGDGKPFTEYCGVSEDVAAWLEGIKLDYE